MAFDENNSMQNLHVTKNLKPSLTLETLLIAGYFPKELRTRAPKGNLCLVSVSHQTKIPCGLVQLSDEIRIWIQCSEKAMVIDLLLNSSMVTHLCGKASAIIERAGLSNVGELAIDIGRNDGTLLNYLN